MSGKLPQEQGTELIRRLARDDDFRARFEKDPAAALAELGIGSGVTGSLDSKCLAAKSLAPKEAFATLLDDVNGQAFQSAMEMRVPEAQLR